MTKYYGQWETDKIIEEYFPNKNDGICVEVGAYDGVKGSNTKLFEDKGWRTVCIEPNPNIFSELEKNRTGKCLNVACSNYYGDSKLVIFDFKSGVQSSLTSLNTDPRLVKDYADAIERITKSPPVKVVPLSQILWEQDIYNFDFISIDTEGTELDVLEGCALYKFSPKLLVVENNYNDPDIEQYLSQFSYKKDQRYKVNDFYIKG